MKFAVLHINKSSLSSTSPTMRIAKYVHDRLKSMGCDVDFIYDPETAAFPATQRYDVVFVKYGMLAFSDHRAESIFMLNNARRVINLENDYSFVPDKRLRAPDEVWSTVEGRTRYCNWNVLTRHGTEGWDQQRGWQRPRNSGLIYYGAYRPDRVPYFEKYFRHAPYPVTISSFRGEKNFGVLCPNAKLMSAFRDPDGPADWQATIYLEDRASHDLYCSPANRFYECVHMGLAQIVDESAVPTLRRAGIKPFPKDFVVNSKTELRASLQKWEDIRGLQQRHWRRNYAADLHEQFNTAMKESGLR
jgi:hypothetical protein